MPETSVRGPGGYAEVSATAGTPSPLPVTLPPAQVADPFRPPDTSGMGYGHSAGGAAGLGGTHGGSLADKISGTAGMAGKVISLLGDAAAAA
jgi:hypothetical protein